MRHIKEAIQENRQPSIELNLPKIDSNWKMLSTNIDSIIRDIGSFQVSSFQGYNNYLNYLDSLRQILIPELNQRASVVWTKIMDNMELDTSETESLMTELNESANESKNEILKLIEEKEMKTQKLMNKLKRTNFIQDLTNNLRELSFNESLVANQLNEMISNIGKEINLIYTPLEDKIKEIEKELE